MHAAGSETRLRELVSEKQMLRRLFWFQSGTFFGVVAICCAGRVS